MLYEEQLVVKINVHLEGTHVTHLQGNIFGRSSKMTTAGWVTIPTTKQTKQTKHKPER